VIKCRILWIWDIQIVLIKLPLALRSFTFSGWVIQYIGVNKFFSKCGWGLCVSKDAEFNVGFKNINLPFSEKMQLKKVMPDNNFQLFTGTIRRVKT
jgi:hypothetical protein